MRENSGLQSVQRGEAKGGREGEGRDVVTDVLKF